MNRTTFVLAMIALMAVPPAMAQETTNLQAQLINTDPVPLAAGEDGDVVFKVRNTGTTAAENVTLELLDYYPFSIKPDRPRTVQLGTIVPGERYTVSTAVHVAEEADDGSHQFRVRLSMEGFSATDSMPVEVRSDDVELAVANINTAPSSLLPDTDDNKLTVDVVNNGDAVAENVVMMALLPEGFEPVSSLSERSALGNLAAGERKTASFTFDLSENVSSGAVSLPLPLQYSRDDDLAPSSINESVELYVEGAPRFAIVDTRANLSVGDTGRFFVTVRNTGSEKATSTRLRVLDNADTPFSYDSSSAFIGSLRPGETGKAVIEPSVDAGAVPKDYLFDLEVRGVAGTQVFVEDFVQRVAVMESSGSSSRPYGIAGLLVVVAVVAGLFAYGRWWRSEEE